MITILVGTHRPDSFTERVAHAYADVLEQLKEPSQILDLKQLPANFMVSDMFGARSEGVQQMIDTYIQDVEHFVFVLPEYNGGFPGVMKLFIDGIEPKLWHGKWAGLVGVSSGHAGNLRGLDQMGNVLNYLKVNTLYSRPKLSKVEGRFEKEGIDSSSRNQLMAQASELVKLRKAFQVRV